MNSREQLLFETIIGSQAYGTAVEGSDIDMKGVYAQHPEDLMSFGYREQKRVSKDEEYFELKRFVQLASSSNPTIIELLWMPEDCVRHVHPAFQHLIDNRDAFLTKQCRHSFAGYAIQQIKKARGLEKKMNWERDRVNKKNLVDFCYVYDNGRSVKLLDFLDSMGMKQENCGIAELPHFRDGYNLYYSENPDLVYRGIEGKNYALKLSRVPEGQKPVCIMHYNKDGFMKHSEDYKSYEVWLKERNVQRYVDLKNHGQKIDGKNMLHCMRLIDEAVEIAEQKTINIRRPNADYLISIRKGEVDLEVILEQAEAGIDKMREAFADSDLPDGIDEEQVNQLLIESRRLIDWD
ncbi:MAG: nucleotidyltransferase domain-containing protein [bacterium]|nr:nucleotidyltransferase domain-containing protein [bacterium]